MHSGPYTQAGPGYYSLAMINAMIAAGFHMKGSRLLALGLPSQGHVPQLSHTGLRQTGQAHSHFKTTTDLVTHRRTRESVNFSQMSVLPVLCRAQRSLLPQTMSPIPQRPKLATRV